MNKQIKTTILAIIIVATVVLASALFLSQNRRAQKPSVVTIPNAITPPLAESAEHSTQNLVVDETLLLDTLVAKSLVTTITNKWTGDTDVRIASDALEVAEYVRIARNYLNSEPDEEKIPDYVEPIVYIEGEDLIAVFIWFLPENLTEEVLEQEPLLRPDYTLGVHVNIKTKTISFVDMSHNADDASFYGAIANALTAMIIKSPDSSPRLRELAAKKLEELKRFTAEDAEVAAPE